MRTRFLEAELKDTIFHRLDVRTKMLMLLCVAVLGMALEQWKALAVVYLAVLALAVVARLSADKWKALLILSFLTLWGMMWVQAIFYNAYPRTPLLYLLPPMVISPSTPLLGGLWEGIAFYYEGFTYGMAQSLRMIAPMTLGLVIFWTEDPVRILTGLNKLKLPYAVCFMVMTCLRFIPITFAEAKVTLDSQRLRKYKPFEAKGVILGYGIYKTTVRVLVPLLANCVRKAANMAKSADSRAFRASDQRTELHEVKIKAGDKMAVLLFVGVLIVILACKLLLYLSEADRFTSDLFVPIYWFTHRFL
ncbi:energy-coupling factor transporter transmembrane protein EcfT [Dehalobacter sp. DCM]|uniref:energy-coupling factor transporter transmembrane component T family protein n=1 Tax=Dehalobacter sp. DCM TaxID=2907827 RepID=UPI003081FE99|nr:energy-coupling factor transporter transmembrane protein EcfT [Dehalobacter sp. DCM]